MLTFDSPLVANEKKMLSRNNKQPVRKSQLLS